MKKVFTKIFAMLLTLVMLLGVMNVTAFAEEINSEIPTGGKSATLIDREENRYEIEVRVPGVDGDNRHDEIIVMVDGSTSVDSEWPAMSSAVKQIGADFLNGSGNTQLTLMAFGISPTVVKAHITSYAELEALLDQYQGNLLYGRSGTNCSAAFDGIREYISEHDNTLNEAYVIYISDGRVNLNNAPYVWKDRISGEVDAVIEEILGVYDSAEPSNAYMTVFGDKAEELKLLAKGFFDNYADKTVRNTFIAQMVPIVTEMTEDGTVTKAKRWASIVFEDVFAAMGLDENTAYPMHVVEKAFVDYKYETNTNCQEAFYCTAGSLTDNYNHTANGQARAISAGQAAAEVAEEIFLVRYNGNYKSVWMENLDRDNVTLVDAGSVANVSAAIKESVAEYTKTPFNDVVVTDYMSKWVNLDVNSLKIVDNSTGAAIWTAADGWLINEGRPTAQEVPVVVELVDPADYAAGGDDVIGNTNGDIYKLTWYVKDGAMLRSDTYSLKYNVVVDTAESGFVADTQLPSNGNTDLHYTDENGNRKTEEIEVPTVDAPLPEEKTPTITFKSGQASNISFMLIDKATGKVEFVEKIDIGSQTSFEIPTAEGKISAVFVKQSTSGMFWASEEIDEKTQNAVIKCLKANNPSYKGHWAEFFFGEGDCTWEFKKNKSVTYTFSNVGATVEAAKPVVTPEVEAPVAPPKAEEPVAPPKAEKPAEVEKKAEITVKGAKETSRKTIGGVTVIYIAANGKIPAVIWAESDTGLSNAELIAEFGAGSDAKVIFGLGKHTIEYQQNKNKTKTVTYTFEVK